jgi:membrane-associated progesterone receptor component
MQAERADLGPPKDDPFTLEQLKAFDGSDPERPIYVAIKGWFFPLGLCQYLTVHVRNRGSI